MKHIIKTSVDFTNESAQKWIEQWIQEDQYKFINGFELDIDLSESKNREELELLVPLFKKKKWSLQLSGQSVINPDINLLFFCNRLSQKLKKEIVLSMEGIYTDEQELDAYKTFKISNKIRHLIDSHQMNIRLVFPHLDYWKAKKGHSLYINRHLTKDAGKTAYACELTEVSHWLHTGSRIEPVLTNVYVTLDILDQMMFNLTKMFYDKCLVFEISPQDIHAVMEKLHVKKAV